MSTETLVEEWLTAEIAAAAPGDVLEDVQVAETDFSGIKRSKCVMIGPCQSYLSPSWAADDAAEFDGNLRLVIYTRVDDRKTDSSYREARETAISVGKAIATKIFSDNTLGGRVLDCLPRQLARGGFDAPDRQPLAVANLYLQVNQTGQVMEG